MITIFSGRLDSGHLVLARHQNDAIRIPISIYYSSITEYKFATGFNVDTGELLVQKYKDYFWINKPEPPKKYLCGYIIGVKPGIIDNKYSVGYKIRFPEREELRYRTLFKRHFLFNDKIKYSYKAGFKFKLGTTRLKLNYRTAFRVTNIKRDPAIFNYKCPYRYNRIGQSEYKYIDAFDVVLVNGLEFDYHAGYRHSVSKFVFPRKYNTNAAGANTSIAELPIPWKIIKQKDSSSGIRIALDKSKLDLGSDGLRIYLNFPPKYINYCTVMRDKFETVPDAPVVPPVQPPAPPTPSEPNPNPPAPPEITPPAPPPAPEQPPVTPNPDTGNPGTDTPGTQPPGTTPDEEDTDRPPTPEEIAKFRRGLRPKNIDTYKCKYNMPRQDNIPAVSESRSTDPTIPEGCYRINHGIRFQCLNVWEDSNEWAG